jgi:hypothetical protein
MFYPHHVVNRQFEDMADFQTPEILRVPLDELCLQIKLLELGDIEEFLSKVIIRLSIFRLSIVQLQVLN